MLAYIPYMDPMGKGKCLSETMVFTLRKNRLPLSSYGIENKMGQNSSSPGTQAYK